MNNVLTTTSEVIDDGEYQIIDLPEGFQFNGDEVWVQKVGNSVILYPIDKLQNRESSEIK